MPGRASNYTVLLISLWFACWATKGHEAPFPCSSLYNLTTGYQEVTPDVGYYSVAVCHRLGLAYIHIFKNAGSSMQSYLSEFCYLATGRHASHYVSFGSPEKQLQHLDHLCSQWVCYTFWREPLDRLFSAYHEVMKRTFASNSSKPPNLHLTPLALGEDATQRQKVAAFKAFFHLIESHQYSNPHVGHQVDFIYSSGRSNMANLYVGNLRQYDRVLPILFCGSVSRCLLANTNSAKHKCPSVDFGKNIARSRMDRSYSLPQYVVAEDDIDDDLVMKIVTYYKNDYCHFGIPFPPRMVNMVNCSHV
jgi:hypothetical protein